MRASIENFMFNFDFKSGIVRGVVALFIMAAVWGLTKLLIMTGIPVGETEIYTFFFYPMVIYLTWELFFRPQCDMDYVDIRMGLLRCFFCLALSIVIYIIFFIDSPLHSLLKLMVMSQFVINFIDEDWFDSSSCFD